MNERLQLALIVGCGFVIGLEAPGATRLVLESWTGPYAPTTSLAHGASRPSSALLALAELEARLARERELVARVEAPSPSAGERAPLRK